MHSTAVGTMLAGSDSSRSRTCEDLLRDAGSEEKVTCARPPGERSFLLVREYVSPVMYHHLL